MGLEDPGGHTWSHYWLHSGQDTSIEENQQQSLCPDWEVWVKQEDINLQERREFHPELKNPAWL